MEKNEDKKVAAVKEKSTVKTVEKKKRPNLFKRLWKKIKELASECKKITWPTFGKTMQQLGVVLLVVVLFLIVISLFDWGLSFLLKLIRPETASLLSDSFGALSELIRPL